MVDYNLIVAELALVLAVPPFVALWYDRVREQWVARHPLAVSFQAGHTSVEPGSNIDVIVWVRNRVHATRPIHFEVDCRGSELETVFGGYTVIGATPGHPPALNLPPLEQDRVVFRLSPKSVGSVPVRFVVREVKYPSQTHSSQAYVLSGTVGGGAIPRTKPSSAVNLDMAMSILARARGHRRLTDLTTERIIDFYSEVEKGSFVRPRGPGVRWFGVEGHPFSDSESRFLLEEAHRLGLELEWADKSWPPGLLTY